MSTKYSVDLIARAKTAFPNETELPDYMEEGSVLVPELVVEAYANILLDEFDPQQVLEWLQQRYTNKVVAILLRLAEGKAIVDEVKRLLEAEQDGPPCTYCGTTTKISGSSYKCPNCGSVVGAV